MNKLKNKFGDNLSWLLSDVTEQIKCNIEESDTIESSFEIWVETEDGREARCDVDLVDLLESAQAEISEKEKVIHRVYKKCEFHIGKLLKHNEVSSHDKEMMRQLLEYIKGKGE